MEKIQHNLNSLSLIFSGFFVMEILIFIGLLAYPNPRPTTLQDIAILIGFFSMIPVSILLVQLSGKFRSVALLWSAIGLFILHYGLLFFS